MENFSFNSLALLGHERAATGHDRERDDLSSALTVSNMASIILSAVAFILSLNSEISSSIRSSNKRDRLVIAASLNLPWSRCVHAACSSAANHGQPS